MTDDSENHAIRLLQKMDEKMHVTLPNRAPCRPVFCCPARVLERVLTVSY